MPHFFYRLLAYVFLLHCLVIGIAMLIGRAQPPQLIAYTYVDETYDPRVMLIDVRTRISVELTRDTAQGYLYARRPQWSPDGEQVAFRAYRNRRDIAVYEYALGDQQLSNLTTRYGYISLPLYAPAGDRLAFPQQITANVPLLLMTADAPTVLAETIRGTPQWSPDGTRIAYIAQRRPDAGEAAEIDDDARSDDDVSDLPIDIYVQNVITGERTNITPETDLFGNPQWSPDGTRLIFGTGSGVSSRRLHMIDLTTGTVTSFNEWIINGEPQWSPRGDTVAVTRSVAGNVDLYLFDWRAYTMQRLTTHPTYDIDPTWSPDGARIAFVSRRGGQDDLYVIDVASRAVTRLTHTPESERDPRWRP
jgi:Tol biopolymer transport system component